MNGIHDLGGREGFGTVEVEPDEPVFHHEWERRAWGLTMGTFVLGVSNGGEFRHSIERMDAVHYLTSPYYEHWVTGVATRLVETGVVPRAELEDRAGGSFPLSAPVADDVRPVTRRGASFDVGGAVRVRRVTTRGHTRCPGYVQERRGVVVRVDRPTSVADVEAHGVEREVEPTYCVRFEAEELWGTATGSAVHVDLYERYLEPAR